MPTAKAAGRKQSRPTVFETETEVGKVGNEHAVVQECNRLSEELDRAERLSVNGFSNRQRHGWRPSGGKLTAIDVEGTDAAGRGWTWKCYLLPHARELWAEWLDLQSQTQPFVDGLKPSIRKPAKSRKKTAKRMIPRILEETNCGKQVRLLNQAAMVLLYDVSLRRVRKRIGHLKPEERTVQLTNRSANQDFWWESKVDQLLRSEAYPAEASFTSNNGKLYHTQKAIAKRLGLAANTVAHYQKHGLLASEEMKGPKTGVRIRPSTESDVAELEVILEARRDGRIRIDGVWHISADKAAARLRISRNALLRYRSRYTLKIHDDGYRVWYVESQIEKLQERIDAANADPRSEWPCLAELSREHRIDPTIMLRILNSAIALDQLPTFAPGVPIKRLPNKPQPVLYEPESARLAIAAHDSKALLTIQAAARTVKPVDEPPPPDDAQQAVDDPKKREPYQWLAEALVLLKDHPDWSDRKIAREVGVSPATLSRSKPFQAAKKQGAKSDLPRGYKDAAGNLDAYR